MSNDVTADLIVVLVENMKGAPDDWASLSIVVDINAGRLSGTYGYAYSPDGTASAVASRPSGVRTAVEAYLESHGGPDRRPPLKLLVQFDRSSGRYVVTFEEHDPSRWKVSPANVQQISDELRPDFG